MRTPLCTLILILCITLLTSLTSCHLMTMTPLGKAASKGEKDAILALLDRGANLHERDSYYGYTPLHWAAWKGQTDIVRILIDRGADINAESPYYYGKTPLHAAAYSGHLDVVRILIDKGADPSITDEWGRTPLRLAQEQGHITITQILRKAEKERNLAAKKPPHFQAPSTPEKPSVESDVDELPVIKAKPNKNAYAIVIGIESYRQKLPKADYAVNDAKTMTEYLTKVMGYPEENVVTLLNDRALKSDMEKYFKKWLFNNVEKDGSVFIYYSGHGAPNPKTGDAFIVPYDGDPSFIDQTGYSLKRLYESLGRLPAKEIVVALDSCFSGAGGRSVIAKGARPLMMTMESFAIPLKVAVLSAASGDQISSTYEEKGHGLFTYFMLKALKGEGDTNGDGKIEIGELFNYIKPQVERIARKVYNNEQSPQLVAPEMLKKQRLIER